MARSVVRWCGGGGNVVLSILGSFGAACGGVCGCFSGAGAGEGGGYGYGT